MAVIKALKEEVCSLSPAGLLVEGVKVLAQNFEQLLYSHTKRGGLYVAHNLVRYNLRNLDFLA